MPALNDVVVTITSLADTVGVKKMQTSLGELGATTKATSAESGAFGSSIGMASLAVAAAAVTIGVVAVKSAGDFQQSMTKLVTSAGEVTGNLKLVSDGVLQVARDTGTSTTELADGMYKIESGGFHGAAGLLLLKAAAQGAKAEGSDLKTTADALSSAMVDYHYPAEQAADVTSKLVAATAAGKMSFQDLAAAMPAILPVASAAHISLNDILGDMASMTVHGMSAQQAAENLTDVIRHMQAPTALQGKELAMLGLTTTQLASDMKNNGLSGVLNEISTRITNLMPPGTDKVILNLRTALSGLSAPVQELGGHLFDGTMTMKEYTKAAQALDPISAKQAISFATLAGATHRIGDEQMTGAAVLQNYGQAMAKATGDATGLKVGLMLTGENADTTTNAIKAVTNATAEAGGNVKGWSEIQGNFNTKLAEFGQYINTAMIQLGTGLLPVLGNAITGFMNFTNTLGQFMPAIAGVGAAIIGYRTVLIANNAVQLIHSAYIALTATKYMLLNGSLIAVRTATVAETVAQGALNFVMNMNPIGIVVMLLGGLTAALIATGVSSGTATAATTKLDDARKKLTEDTKAAKDAENNLKDANFNLEGATLRVEQAQQNYNAAVAQYGPTSLQARQAAHDLKGAQDDLANATDNARQKTDDLKNSQDAIVKDKENIKNTLKEIGGAASAAAGGYSSLANQVNAYSSAVKKSDMPAANQAQVNAFKIPTMGIPHRASGGSVSAGQPYIVNENEGELFVPDQGGKILNGQQQRMNKSTGNTTTNHITVNNPVFSSGSAVTAFFDKYDQDGILASKGLTTNRGTT